MDNTEYMDCYVEGKTFYSEGFINGYNDILYGENENIDISPADIKNLKSIGYRDGCIHGEYCKMIGQGMAISREQLIASIDKAYSHSFDTYYKAIYNIEDTREKGSK